MTPRRPIHNPHGRVHLLLLIGIATAFAGVLLWMLNLRLSAGDTYEPYSSLRADPLGCRVLYLALDRLDGIDTERHTRSMSHLKPDDRSAVLFMALPPEELTLVPAAKEDEMIDEWLGKGSHLLIALKTEVRARPSQARGLIKPRAATKDPEKANQKAKPGKKDESADPKQNPAIDPQKPATGEPQNKTQDEPIKEEDKKNEDKKDEEEEEESISVFGLLAQRSDPDFKTPAEQKGEGRLSGMTLPPWRGSHFLTIEEGSAWKPLARIGEHITMAELQREKGSIIVVSDAYPFSNEAQLRERHADLLLALIAGKTRIIFNEYHLGVSTDPGIMQLVRQHHLHGLVAGGLLLLLLLFWQGSSSLIPPRPDQDFGIGDHGAVSGRDSADGLVALLETGLKPSALLTECIERHRATATVNPPSAETLREARAIAEAARAGTLAQDFERIARLFSIKPSTKPSANPKPSPAHGPD